MTQIVEIGLIVFSVFREPKNVFSKQQIFLLKINGKEMDLNQEIKAQLDQNEAANMLAKVGLSLQDCSTERDLQLLVADYR